MELSKATGEENMRRGFLHGVGGEGAFLGMASLAGHAGADEPPKDADGKVIPGFEKNQVPQSFQDRFRLAMMFPG